MQTVMTIFMLIKTKPVWLALKPDDRFDFLEKSVKPLLEKYANCVRLRHYDAEFYSARVSDVWVWDVGHRHDYEMVIEGLRETPFWDFYFDIVEIIPSVENAYAQNYGRPVITV